MQAIKITNLSLKYKNQCIFRDFSFTLQENKWSCLLGVSGVGKSTLLRIIAGLISKERTDYQYTFSSTLKQSESKAISYMAQQDLLLPWLTVLENILIGYRLRQEKILATTKERAKELLQHVGLKTAANLLPEQLSPGMRQRVALVRTLIEDRPIVLMDEPFSALDAITKIKLQTLAAELLQNRTVLLVTHDPLEALRLGDLIYVLSGSPAKLTQAITPKGNAPRDVSNLELLNEQAELLKLLATEQDN